MSRPTLTPEDRLDLADLPQRYAAYVDGRDFDAAARLFADDGVLAAPDPPRSLDPAAEAVGPAAIAAALARLRELALTVHAVAGVVVDLSGPDTARGRVVGTAHHLTERETGLVDVVWHLRYLDTYRRTEAGWRFTRRDLHIDLIESRKVLRVRPWPADPSVG